MSYRVAAFTVANPQPQTLCNYVVQIPGIISSPIIVESAIFPQEQFGEVATYYRGEPINHQTRPQAPGTWNCVMTENILGTVGRGLRQLQYNYKDPVTNKLQSPPIDIFIAPMTGTTPLPMYGQAIILKGCWLIGLDDVNLASQAATDPWKWNVRFKYQIIKPYLTEGGLASAIFGQNL